MAMVRQLTEGELMNGSTPEEDSHSSDHLDCYSHSASHSSSDSKRNSPVYLPALQYSKEDLMKYGNLPLSQNRPLCLDPAYNNPTGKWDPERWFMNHRSDRISSGDDSRSKRERQEDGIVSHKRKSSDPKERIKEEKDDIVLSPQRRSFGTGCHVIQQSSLARRPGSPTDGRESENYRDPSRRIGSGRIMARDRDQRDWERDREYGYGSNRNERRDRFDQDDNEKDARRYSNRYARNDRRSRGRDRIDEVEPEWFSGGPTSQSETIELVGFEEQNDDDNRKSKKSNKRAKQNSRRSSLKSEEGEKIEPVVSEELSIPSLKKANLSQEEPKSAEIKNEEMPDITKPNNAGFDLDDLFRMDWIPGLLQNESPPNTMGSEMGCSRFSQWFKRDSPQPESGNNSRRSSLHEELIANVLNSIAEPQIIIPSPTPNSSDTFFTPISPALSHSTSYSAPHSLASGSNSNKGIMDMLQSANTCSDTLNGANQKDSKSVKELEADLKRIVLGGDKQQQQERSAFDKLLQHMSESRNSPASSLSIGPLDKSKALQEQDLLQDMLGSSRQSSVSPIIQPFQMFKEDKPISQHSSGMHRNQFPQTLSQPNQNEIFAHLMQQQQQQHPKQQEQHLSHSAVSLQQLQMQQQQMQNHLQQQQQQSQHMNVHGFPADMLAKIFGSQTPASPVSPGLHQSSSAPSLNQNEPMNPVLQFHRQQELLSSLLKQQHTAQNVSQSTLLQRRQRPSTKEIPIQQTLGLPTLGISPRQSPLPTDAVNSAMSSQGRIPSPLVFGQQPPALSHAPAPIHPAALVQAMAQQNAANSNTLQVQNPVVLQRVPSPQELAVHTQSILQNALIKRKLEEQKENFRKRQEAQRTNSPVTSNKNGMTVSPLKGLSPTIAFTPTSVMRKIQSEKTESKEQKNVTAQNGNKIQMDSKHDSSSLNNQKINVLNPTSMDCGLNTVSSSSHVSCSQNTNLGQAQTPRALHGQSNSLPRSIHGSMNSVGSSLSIPSQGRPIVKVGLNQSLNPNTELARSNITKTALPHNKQFLSGGGQETITPNNFLLMDKKSHNLHDNDTGFDNMAKFPWQHQLARPQNTSAMPQLQMAATYAALNHRPASLNPHHPSLLRPVNIASSGNVSAPNLNFPLLRNPVQNPIRAQTNTMNQLSNLGLSLQLQRGAIDNRQLQALAQSQRFHPATLQQLLMNSQNPVSAQAQVVAGYPGNRDNKHQHLLPGQSSTNRQSPVNLAKWFGSDVLKQKMPEMPPVSHQKALLVEDVERQQQQSAAVHN